MASAWVPAYPASHIARPGESVLAALGDERLWAALADLGIRGVHTGPMKLSGGVTGRDLTPSCDGNFDRIAMAVDPAFGSEAEYVRLASVARAHGGIVIGDIIPGHTGKGYDFRLAERAYRDYPGLYHMVEIDPADWALLPAVPAGKDSVNLLPETIDQLCAKGYVPGHLARTIFYAPGVKETDFSATDVVVGVDGRPRRWVYLHYFKDGQPTLDWLDPSFAAQRLVLGDAVHSLRQLGDSMLRLDANGFLGIEPKGTGYAWSEGHPLSVTSNQLIAGLVRRLGGFTFQELNLTLQDLRDMSRGGADLSYDFVTRPAYHHALVTGDARFLRLMLDLQRAFDIDPASLIHALQNHDELTLELVHFMGALSEKTHPFRGRDTRSIEVRDAIRTEMLTSLLAPAAPYNLEAANGVSCTTASLVAASLGIRDLDTLTAEQVESIKRGHLLLAMYNAMQPGVFALSGWDLVGAVPLPHATVAHLMGDGDTRWIQRGAYDLLDIAPSATESAGGMPRARALYGSLPAQLADPTSFASSLKRILAVRERYEIHSGRRIDTPTVTAPGLVVLVHVVPRGIQLTVLNFGRSAIDEIVTIPSIACRAVGDLLADAPNETADSAGGLRLRVPPLTGLILLAGTTTS
jgi:trehalose synthase